MIPSIEDTNVAATSGMVRLHRLDGEPFTRSRARRLHT
jgi:hypothetical protein